MDWIKNTSIRLSIVIGSFLPAVSWGQAPRPTNPINGTVVVSGKILDGQTRKPIVGATVLAKNQSGAVRSQQTTNVNGSYLIALDPKQIYTLTTQAEGYIALNEQLAATSPTTTEMTRQPVFLYREVPKSGGTTTLLKEATPPTPAATPPPTASAPSPQPTATSAVSTQSRVTPPKTLDAKIIYTPPLVATAGRTTQLKALRFVQSKAELLPDAQPTLDQLLTFLRDHPTTEIELAGHTDNQGDFDENLRLSKQRVDTVKEYLVKNGVASKRIVTRGFGPTRPISSNNSEATRQLNRRVEMTVIKE